MIAKRFVSRLVLFTFLISLSGCSTQFGYRFADTFVEWQLAKYVELSGPLEDNVERSIDELHMWHARTQLPAYRNVLEQLIQDLDQDTVDAVKIVAYSEQLFSFWQAIRNQLEPYALTYLPQLSEAQREQLISNLRERIEEEREEAADLNERERYRERLERTLDRAKEWLGPLQSEQRTLLRRWLEERVSNDELWLVYQEDWLDAFAATVRAPEAEGFADGISLLITRPEAYRSDALIAATEFNRALTMQLMVDLYSTLSDGQKRHLRNKLAGYRETVDSLINNFAT
ncbi:DUF6279 family lipoprotein [Pseudidiomarina terrestris]|uniref:Lipoprotein n=1 Tax=Pseudidiomarina terrestris TaxID=2820060 RepID=A0AAW7QU71_9GAMM|nr:MULTISPECIES: DUF6279 family lipoprotein [unclassified Pseudidiomarina]MDN7123712.1 hypothetical protein [Pseudidiomarina sp. 1APP75-32.1]MDN7126498.1 hypothetical protein [Pseudidiomarina sp. 1APR75-33.1]MDN7128564.1 hypothetical protein [Pseudidiomarina sp. 1APR75-15]MDN7135178.1 hypothetical protein [Pseudidiomarina sp. 1ASP75-5]MDN7137847.1 hypothetical protein [Pseudidiomarina sp. 1ASP75-14]